MKAKLRDRLTRNPIRETDAWREYVEQMESHGIEVEFGVATPQHFYDNSNATPRKDADR